MIRIVVQEIDHNAAAHVGGPIQTSLRSFDIEAPEVERYLADSGGYLHRQVLGVEVLGSPAAITVDERAIPVGGSSDTDDIPF